MVAVHWDTKTDKPLIIPSKRDQERFNVITEGLNEDVASIIKDYYMETKLRDLAGKYTNKINGDIENTNKENIELYNNYVDIIAQLDYSMVNRVPRRQRHHQLLKTKDLIKKYQSVKGNNYKKYDSIQKYIYKYLTTRQVKYNPIDMEDLAKSIAITSRNLPTIEQEVIEIEDEEEEQQVPFLRFVNN